MIAFVYHFIATILSFLLISILIFYITLKTDVRYGKENLDYLLSHPTVYLCLCIIGVIITNLVVSYRLMNRISIRYFEFDNIGRTMMINFRTGYSNKDCLKLIPYEEFTYKHYKTNHILSGKKTILEVFDNNESTKIDLSDFIWSSDKKAILTLRQELEKLKNCL
jgi:hypothetical protein